MSKPPKYGHHPSINRGYLDAVARSLEMGATAAQMWMGNSKGYASKLIPAKDYVQVAEIVNANDFFLIAHSPYIINCARDLIAENNEKALQRYLNDLINVTNLGGVGSVLHMGFNVKALNQTDEEACRTFAKNLDWISERMPKHATIILENMAGKGTAMCCEMKEWGQFWNDHLDDALRKRIKWCVDTAHLFATGEYNVSKRRDVFRFYDDFEEHIGWDNLLCFHFNGSKSALGSCVDHHADIGPEMSGLIETKGLRQLARIAGATQKPLIMEVPIDTVPLAEQYALIESWF